MEDSEKVLEAVRSGASSIPEIARATGLAYSPLQTILYSLETTSLCREENGSGFARYSLSKSEDSKRVHGEIHAIPPQAQRLTVASEDARDLAIQQRAAPYCAGCRGLCFATGRDRNGRQRWKCRPCNITFLGTGAMNEVKAEKRAQAVEMFRSAKSVRQVVGEVGISKQTAQSIRNSLPPITCPCGKDAKHQEWCEFRIENSPVRKAYLEGTKGVEVLARMDEDQVRRDAETKIAEIVERGSTTPPKDVCQVCKDLPQLFAGKCVDCMSIDEQTMFGQSVNGEELSLCGCGRPSIHKGRCAARRLAAGRDFPSTKAIEKRDAPEIVVAESEQFMAARRTAPEPSYQVKYEGVTIYCDTQDKVVEIVNRLQNKFAPALVPAAVPTQPLKLAWSKEFETDDPEGATGLTYLYLISMLHDGMEQAEKDAVWTLVLYLKRVSAAMEASKPSP